MSAHDGCERVWEYMHICVNECLYVYDQRQIVGTNLNLLPCLRQGLMFCHFAPSQTRLDSLKDS